LQIFPSARVLPQEHEARAEAVKVRGKNREGSCDLEKRTYHVDDVVRKKRKQDSDEHRSLDAEKADEPAEKKLADSIPAS
jgi:hypothetical protein